MGFWNPRAICPNCGAKIHTQPAEGLSYFVGGKQTGKQCPQCGVALTGKRGWAGNEAKLAPPPLDEGVAGSSDPGSLGKIVVLTEEQPVTAETPRPTPDGRDEAPGRAAGVRTIPEQIRELGELRDEGLVNDEEFEAKKAELLDRL